MYLSLLRLYQATTLVIYVLILPSLQAVSASDSSSAIGASFGGPKTPIETYFDTDESTSNSNDDTTINKRLGTVRIAGRGIIEHHKPFAGPSKSPRKARRGNLKESSEIKTVNSALPARPAVSASTQRITSTSTPSHETTPRPATMTSKPEISCILHNEDPDQGINQAFCLCDGSKTLSPLSIPSTGQQSDSCAYTTIPLTNAEKVTTLKRTYTSNCQVCTQIQLNAPTCTSKPGCSPPKATASATKLTVTASVTAGNSAIHVGTLTGTDLFTSISSALDQLCPPVTQTASSTTCVATGVSIGNIAYTADEFLETDGTLTVSVPISKYNDTSLRNAMIHSAAMTMQVSSLNAKNCYQAAYNMEQMKKRDLPLLSFGSRNQLAMRDRPYDTVEHVQFCNAAGFAAVNYWNPWGHLEGGTSPSPTDQMYVEYNFQMGPEGDFVCDFLSDLSIGLGAFAPEFAPVALGMELASDAIGVACEAAAM